MAVPHKNAIPTDLQSQSLNAKSFICSGISDGGSINAMLREGDQAMTRNSVNRIPQVLHAGFERRYDAMGSGTFLQETKMRLRFYKQLGKFTLITL